MVMKNTYVKPEAFEESFAANDFIATCAPGKVTWLIKCNVPYGYGFYDTNGNGKRDSNEPKIATGTGCKQFHETELDPGVEPSKDAMWQELNYWDKEKGSPYPVFYFNQKGESGHSNHHFSTLATSDDSKVLGQMS